MFNRRRTNGPIIRPRFASRRQTYLQSEAEGWSRKDGGGGDTFDFVKYLIPFGSAPNRYLQVFDSGVLTRIHFVLLWMGQRNRPEPEAGSPELEARSPEPGAGNLEPEKGEGGGPFDFAKYLIPFGSAPE
jgi:hypothetical protein